MAGLPARPSGAATPTGLAARYVAAGPGSTSPTTPGPGNHPGFAAATTAAAAGPSPQLTNTRPLIDEILDATSSRGRAVKFPPDTQFAVGQAQFLEMTNGTVTVHSRAPGDAIGGVIKRVSEEDFFLLPQGLVFSDPNLFYDASVNRWFATGLAFDPVTFVDIVLVAASPGPDATAQWNVYSNSPSATAFFDQPKLGVSDDKVVLGWNSIDNTGVQSGEMVVLQKADLVAGANNPSFFSIPPDPARPSPVPVRSLSSTTTQYVVYNNADPSTPAHPATAQNLGRPTLGVVAITGTPARSCTGAGGRLQPFEPPSRRGPREDG